MTTLAAFSNVTLTLGDGGYVTVSTNGGMASVTASPISATPQTATLGPLATRRTFGPYAEGASVTINNQSGPLDYDYFAGNLGVDLAALQSLVSGDGNWVTLYPSGDTSGATDYANVSQYLTAAVAKNIRLAAGNWYFNDTLVRMPRRNSTNTGWASTSLLGRDDAMMPSFVGSGSSSCILNFTNPAKPAMYVWRPPAGISGGPTLNVRARSNAADVSNDPYAVASGVTSGFTISGAANYTKMAGTLYDLDNENAWPNHIGLTIWGAMNIHEVTDVKVMKFGTGIVLHDTTGATFNRVVVRECDIGWGLGIQTDGNNWLQCWTEQCRVGHSLVWDGWQTGTGRAATFAGVGRESSGNYLAFGSCDNDGISFQSCFWVGCTFAAIASHAYVDNTQNVDAYSTNFNTCYWESNGSVFYGFRNIGQGAFSFKHCNFRGLANGDVVGSYVQGGAKTGGASEILRKYILGRFGVNQSTADANFAAIGWGYGGGSIAVGLMEFENCHFDPCPYPTVFSQGQTQVLWKHNYYPNNGASSFPTIFANLTNSTKGYRVVANQQPWSNANSQDWGDYMLQAGFVAASNGVPTAVSSSVTLPTASVAFQGQTRMLLGAPGAADTLYQCMKSAADTYNWKLVSTG